MRLRAPDLEVNSEDPFKADALDLREFANALQEVVGSSERSLVVSLDAPWGQGKTTFLRMWRQQLENAGVTSLYFNAWETDFAGDPMLALLAELGDELKRGAIPLPNSAKAHFEKAKKIGLKLAKNAVPVAAKIATAGILDLSDFNEAALSDFAERLAEAQLKEFQDSKQSIVAFRKELQTAASKLGKKDNAFPLLVVVDELDRCRPDYAIRVLETIKHFFSVPNVVFVVATDLRQLAASVRHTYGQDIDADAYLRRFFDLPVALPRPSISSFIEAQFSRFALEEFFRTRTHQELRYDRENLLHTFVALLSPEKASLRDAERCFALIALAVRATPSDHHLHPLLLCALVTLRVKNLDLYERYVDGSASVQEVVAYFSATRAGKKFFSSQRTYGAIVEGSLIAARESNYDDGDPLAAYKARAEDQNAPERDRKYAERVVEAISQGWLRKVSGSLRRVVKKIELAERAPELSE